MPGKPINTATKNERKLNFWERLYLPEVLKGLGWSIRKIWREPSYTFQYPEEQWYPPDGYRGRPVLVEDQGKTRCVSCNLCARACPPMAISMESQEIDGPKERAPLWFEIDMLRCIYCGYCQEVCPEEAIWLQDTFSVSGYTREELVYQKDKLYELGGTLPDDHLKWDKKKAAEETGNAH